MTFYAAPSHARVTPATIPEKSELVEVLTGGEVTFEVDGQWKTFGRGTIFWHQAGEKTIWRTTPEAPYRCAVFHFHVHDLDRPVPRVSFWDLNARADLDGFISECIGLFHSQRLDPEVLALYIYSTLLRHALVHPNPAGGRNYPKPLDRSLVHIHGHIGKNLSIMALARQSQISRAQLFRLFQAHLGVTPHQYILAQKLARARIMLADATLPIKDIAAKCGFGNVEVFYRRFHRASGMTPGEYRLEHLPYHFPPN